MSLDWLDDVTRAVTTWGVTALGGIALIIAGVVIARFVRRLLLSALRATRLDEQLVGLIATIAYYFAIAVILIAAFGVMGIETASLITILGTCSLALGLALQGSLSNFSSGVMLFVFRPFRVGDFVETGDYVGHVSSMGLFSTELTTLQNVLVSIPNTYISQRPIENWSANGTCRLDLAIEISIDSDLRTVKEAITNALATEPRLLHDPAAFVGVENFGDTSAQLVIRPWCKTDDYWRLKYELPEKIKDAVEGAGGAMPTPQRDILIRHEGSA
jgi:small conductance mechanosensitive channel